MNYLRSYALSHTTSRIDVELGSQLFEHMLRLPISYHDTRAAGQTVARVRELETIRSFLTGQGLSSIIDIAFAVIFIAVLFNYSHLLTWIALMSIPAYLAVTFLIRPLLRDRINERFKTGAASQQLRVETIIGFQTLKSGAVEPAVRVQWERRLADYVRASFDAVNLSNLSQNAFQFINDSDIEALKKHCFAEEDAWGIAAISAFFGMSYRLANVTSMKANPEFYTMGW